MIKPKPALRPAALEVVDAPSTALALVRKPRFRSMTFKTIKSVRVELSTIYTLAKRGILPSSEASRLTFILGAIGKLVTDESFEARLEQLEQAAGK